MPHITCQSQMDSWNTSSPLKRKWEKHTKEILSLRQEDCFPNSHRPYCVFVDIWVLFSSSFMNSVIFTRRKSDSTVKFLILLLFLKHVTCLLDFFAVCAPYIPPYEDALTPHFPCLQSYSSFKILQRHSSFCMRHLFPATVISHTVNLPGLWSLSTCVNTIFLNRLLISPWPRSCDTLLSVNILKHLTQ